MLYMGTRQTIVHVGYPKTGSTFLQSELFAEHSQLEDFGGGGWVSDKDYNHKMAEVINNINEKESLDFDLESCENRVSGALKNVPENKNIIISSEGLSCPGWADRQLIINRIHDLFGDCKIIVVIRKREDLIKSTCFQHLKYGLFPRFDDINEWLEGPLKFSQHIAAQEYSHPIHRLRYYPFLHALEKKFSKENIQILLYEELKSNQTQFVQKIAKFCGVDTTEAVQLAGNSGVVNKRGKKEQLYLMSLAKKYPVLKKGTQIFPTKATERIKEIVSSQADFDTELNDYWDEKISKLAKEDNDRIIESFEVSLEKYGYTIS